MSTRRKDASQMFMPLWYFDFEVSGELSSVMDCNCSIFPDAGTIVIAAVGQQEPRASGVKIESAGIPFALIL